MLDRAVPACISLVVLLVACSGTTSSGGTSSQSGSIHVDLGDLSDACTAPADCTAGRMADACGTNCACVLKAFAKSARQEADSRFAVAATACQDGKYPTSPCASVTVESAFACAAGHCRFADSKTGQVLANQMPSCN